MEIDESVIRDALLGNHSVLEEIVRKILPLVQSAAARALLKYRFKPGASRSSIRQEVEDLTQDLLLSIFADKGRQLLAWKAGEGLSFDDFIRLISTRRAISILRTKKRNPWTENPTEQKVIERHFFGERQLPNHANSCSASQNPEQSALLSEELADLVEKLLEKLSPIGQEIFIWMFVEDRSVEEICRLASISADSAYAWRSRISRMAREIHEKSLSEKSRRPRINN